MSARLVLRLLSVLSLLATLMVALPAGTQAATYTVTTLADSGPGSLRQAILDANAAPGADTITFQAGLSGTITLTRGQLLITDDLTLAGPGADVLAVSGNNASRVIEITAGVTVALDGLTIQGGNAASAGATSGGGIYNFGSTLTITNSTVSGNRAFQLGGGIYSLFGTLIVTSSTFSDNQAGFGGGIRSQGTLTITSSTFSGNSAATGGGIRHGAGPFTITSSTITANRAGSASGGAGIALVFTSLQVRGTIVAGNTNVLGLAIDCELEVATITSLGHNLDGDGSCFTGGTDLVNTNPRLGPLADNGGPTLTHLPLADSPAIDTGGPAPCPTPVDQRGLSRPQGGACDIGAVEAIPPPVLTSLSPNRIPLSATAHTITLRGHFFQAGATVLVGAQTYPATFVSSTELRVSLVSRDVFVVGWLVAPMAKVTVVNPDGATSNSLTLYLAP
jgi:predicted outer membrane repeat protein